MIWEWIIYLPSVQFFFHFYATLGKNNRLVTHWLLVCSDCWWTREILDIPLLPAALAFTMLSFRPPSSPDTQSSLARTGPGAHQLNIRHVNKCCDIKLVNRFALIRNRSRHFLQSHRRITGGIISAIVCRFIYRLLIIVPLKTTFISAGKCAYISSHEKLTVADAGFLWGGGGVGCQPIIWPKHFSKKAWNLKKLDREGSRIPGSDNGLFLFSSGASTMHNSWDDQLLFRLKQI